MTETVEPTLYHALDRARQLDVRECNPSLLVAATVD